jgi:hypothetical protein
MLSDTVEKIVAFTRELRQRPFDAPASERLRIARLKLEAFSAIAEDAMVAGDWTTWQETARICARVRDEIAKLSAAETGLRDAR